MAGPPVRNETLDRIPTRVAAQEKVCGVAARAVRIESRTHLLFSFEKMALRDAVKSTAGRGFLVRVFMTFYMRRRPGREIRSLVSGGGFPSSEANAVLTCSHHRVWFIAQPQTHSFSNLMSPAGRAEYGYALQYASRPSWEIYSALLKFAATVRRDLRDLRPRDMIDLQSFIWVQGSDEYEE